MNINNDSGQWSHEEKTYESCVALGAAAIKLMSIINGGAIIALLTFIGNHIEERCGMGIPLILFVAGLFFTGVCSISGYLTQLAVFNRRDEKPFLLIAICSIMLSLFLFLAGSLWASIELVWV